ncbi:MAG TPA: peptidylprolyl isomerase [Agriterribacter sp.]|nr:peptidylprolyl isomerase [Agriterribacter sp.]
MKNILKKLVREPLLHFVLLGILIFIGYNLFSRKNSEPGNIVITKGEIASLKAGYVRTWQREPNDEQLEGLIRDRVKQDVFTREAVAMGLDKDDIIIQRRLQQKMEFILNDNLDDIKQTDSLLTDFLTKHADKFQVDPRFTFKQVFLDPDKRGSSIEKDAVRILAVLNQRDTGFQRSGDYTMLTSESFNERETEITNQFGEEFTQQLKKLRIGKWEGPVKSTYGLHLVKISERTQGGTPVLDNVRESVTREWENELRKDANEKFYQELLKNYNVIVEDHRH